MGKYGHSERGSPLRDTPTHTGYTPMNVLRYIIVVAVFALAGALGGLVAFLVAPDSDITISGFATATTRPAEGQAATDGPPATSTPLPASSPTAPGATEAPAGSPTAGAGPTTTGTAIIDATATSTAPAATSTAPAATATAGPSPAPTVAAPGAIIEYTVQPGDLLSFIAARFNTTIAAIVALNPGLNADNLQVGQVIRIEVGEPAPTATPG